jgi:hypothetical protein
MQQDISKHEQTQDKRKSANAAMQSNKNAHTASINMTPRPKRTKSLTRGGQPMEQPEASNRRKRADSLEMRSPTQQVNILEFLKPNPKLKRGNKKDQEPPKPSTSTPPQPTLETSMQPESDNQMDESTGVDHPLPECSPDEFRGSAEQLTTTEAQPDKTDQKTLGPLLIDTNSVTIEISYSDRHTSTIGNNGLPPLSDPLVPQAEETQPLIVSC